MNKATSKKIIVSEESFKRLYQATDCKTQVELAEFLGITQSSISDAKKRKSIPSEWLITILLERDISPKWILIGEGSRYLSSNDTISTIPQIICPYFRNLQDFTNDELLKELSQRLQG